jgi:hypothetical protein
MDHKDQVPQVNVPRRFVGKVVEVQWMDPAFTRTEIDSLKVGRGALATWREFGVLYDISDNIVMVAHSISRKAGTPETASPDELAFTPIPEALIEKLTVYEPVKET